MGAKTKAILEWVAQYNVVIHLVGVLLCIGAGYYGLFVTGAHVEMVGALGVIGTGVLASASGKHHD